MRRSLAPKPALLTLGQFASALGGALFLLLLATAPFDAGTYSVNSEPVSGPEFLRRAGVAFGLMGTLLLAIALGAGTAIRSTAVAATVRMVDAA